jgi:NADPH-dependent 2,4-dienoyl-CoA reductase/sulfur reductase-like enzyme
VVWPYWTVCVNTGESLFPTAVIEHKVSLRDGRILDYGALLLATGAEPRSLLIKGSNLPHFLRLRTLADSKAIIAKAQQARNCVVIGSSFIGLEVAASLRCRGREVTVISRDSAPLGNILGKELGRFVQRLHEKHGVRFLLGSKPQEILDEKVEIGQGRSVDADLVVLGVGVSPRTSLADEAGIQVDNGVWSTRCFVRVHRTFLQRAILLAIPSQFRENKRG